jgi:hypothetical protein
MSLRYVEMSLYLSDNLSYFRLFSYTFRLRSSFINIFFSGLAPHATLPLRRHHGTSPAPDNLSSVFRVGPGIRPFPPADPVGMPRPPPLPTLQGKPEPRCLVKRYLGHFPTSRKRSYKRSGLPIFNSLGALSPRPAPREKCRNSSHGQDARATPRLLGPNALAGAVRLSGFCLCW